MRHFWVLRGLRILVFVALALLVFGYLVMWLWNRILPALMGWHAIGYGQALGLLVLCRILFGGLHGHAGGWHWRHRMRERLAGMSPEERERFWENLHHHRGGPPGTPSQTAS